MATALAPKTVSPLIRFCRYTALITGVVYGSWRYGYLARKEVVIQEHENKIKAARDKRLAAELAFNSKVEMEELAKDAGIVTKS